MDNCWKRADLFAFLLCCFTLYRLDPLCYLPVKCPRKEVELIYIHVCSLSLPFYLLSWKKNELCFVSTLNLFCSRVCLPLKSDVNLAATCIVKKLFKWLSECVVFVTLSWCSSPFPFELDLDCMSCQSLLPQVCLKGHSDFLFNLKYTHIFSYMHTRKVNRKVQRVPQSQTAVNPRHQEEEKKDRN